MATPRRVLVVKTSSMGDVVHTLPAVTDMLRECPGLVVDWLVEANFADIARAHSGVSRVIPIRWRQWRKALGRSQTWRAMRSARSELRLCTYDHIIDFQGLLKSVVWAKQALGPVAGYDAASIREPLASVFYDQKFEVSRQRHAVIRSRQLAAKILGYAGPASAPDFGLKAVQEAPRPPEGPYAVLVPCASRPEKLWPIDDWVAVGLRLRKEGLCPVVFWGNDVERERASLIASGCEGWVPPFLTVGQSAALLQGGQQLVGLDTGFSHLGAALGLPSVGIYCDHEPGLAGITSQGSVPAFNLGGKGQRPTRDDVLAALERHLQWAADSRPRLSPSAPPSAPESCPS